MNNGLKYYILKNAKPKNSAILNLYISAGSLVESDNQRGYAHFLEHEAFNGTTKYSKNDLVKYLESLGLDFGNDLNAYTTFEETVFKLQVPTESAILDTSFETLKEWAKEITLKKEDIDTEKNIIISEWRLHQGLSKRASQPLLDAIFANSRFLERETIGTPESISKATPELIREFYEKYYAPKNMGIIAVGDFDTKEVETLIKKYFSYDNSPKSQTPEIYSLPATKEQTIVFTDKELTETSLTFINSGELPPVNNSLVAFRRDLISYLFTNILNARFSYLSKQKDSNFINAGIFLSPFGNKNYLIQLSATLKENKINEGIGTITENLKTLGDFGPHSDELKNAKKELLAYLENQANNKSTLENGNFISDITSTHKYGDVFLSPEDKLNEFIKEVSEEEKENLIDGRTIKNPKEELKKLIL